MATRYAPPTNIGSDDVDPPEYIFLGNPAGISAYADQQTDAANAFLLRLGDAVVGLNPPVITPEFPVGPSAPPQETVAAPTLQNVVWTSPSAPPAFTEVLDITAVLPDPFDEDPPTIAYAAPPAAFSELVPDTPGVSLVYEDPTLTVNLPAPPNLLSISVRQFGGIVMPTAPEDVTELDVVAPTIREYIPGDAYTSALLTSATAYLQDIIDNGGTGLNPDVENAIWDRGREREARSAREAIDKINEMEVQGFALPPGAYVDARLKAQTEMDYANRGHSREVMIKQAELAYTAGKDMMALTIQLESKNMDIANSVEQRLFESTRYATEAGIAIYNAQVQGYVAFVEAYKAKVGAYEAEIRAQIALVDAYKAEIEAEQAKAQVNTALVAQYTAQVNAALSAIDIYKAQIEGIKVKAEIEKMKIEIYGEEIKAYVAKINAYTAGVEGYRASLEAEGVKQRVFQSQVEAYSATVTAAAKDAEVRIAAYRGRIDANVAQWEGYKAAWQGEAAHATAVSAYNQSLSSAFESEVRAVVSFNEVLSKQWQVAIEQAQRVAEIGVSAAKANAELYINSRSLATDAAKVGAQVSAQLGAAALNAINWSQSISTSNAHAVSTSYSNASSFSLSQSESHNYNYSV